MRRIMKRAAYLLIGIALLLLVKATYIPVKAQLAQYLLENAWQHTLQTQHPSKPWPWADTWPLAKIEIPALHIRQIILADDSGHSLAFGPGFHLSSSTPGNDGNTIISAHRDTHFRFLQQIKVNDVIRLQTMLGEWLTYQVQHSEIIDSRTSKVRVDIRADWLTLVTCYPFDAVNVNGAMRFVVFAKAVDTLPAAQKLSRAF